MDYEQYYLYHHGIKGMKWGVIRTKMLAARRRQKEAAEARRAKKREAKEAKAAKAKPKSLSDMSDAELKDKINRLSLERQALSLQKEVSSLTPVKTSAGKQFMRDLGSKVIVPSIMDAGKKVATEFLTKQGLKLAGLDTGDVKDVLQEVQKEARILQNKKIINETKKYFAQEEANARAEKEASEKAARDAKEAKTAEKKAAKEAKAAEKQAAKESKAESAYTGTVSGTGKSTSSKANQKYESGPTVEGVFREESSTPAKNTTNSGSTTAGKNYVERYQQLSIYDLFDD